MASSSVPATVLHSYWRSSCSYRVRIMLHWKGLPFAYHAVHLVRGEQRADAHAAFNPLLQVPALEIDGAVLVESQGARAAAAAPAAWRTLLEPPHASF